MPSTPPPLRYYQSSSLFHARLYIVHHILYIMYAFYFYLIHYITNIFLMLLHFKK